MTEILGIDDGFLNAALSLDVYRDPSRPALPAGWEVYLDCPPELQIDGYFGAAYYSLHSIDETLTEVDIVIAHRGTANKDGLMEDIQMYLFDAVPAQFQNAALPFIQQVVEKINQDFTFKVNPKTYYTTDWAFTGHSLGGALAELSCAYCASQSSLKYNPDSSLAIISLCNTFESPGSSELLTVLENEKILNSDGIEWLNEISNTYVADIDAINTALTHPGNYLYIVNVGYDWLPDKTGKLPLVPDLFYYLNKYTIEDQHHMKKMYNAMMNDNLGSLNSISTWPVGAEAGTATFMTYSPEGIPIHSTWWNGYMQRLWQQYPELQSKYVDSFGNPDYYAFEQSYINQYLSGYTTLVEQVVVKDNIQNDRILNQPSVIDVKQHLLPNSFISTLQLKPNRRLKLDSLAHDLVEKKESTFVLK